MRAPAKQGGFTSLELAVAIAVICAFSAVLLGRMLYYEAYAERVHFDLTLRQMQNALRMRVAYLMIDKQPVDYIRIAAENPMDWLEKKPPGYVGVFAGDDPDHLGDGEWAFDSSRHVVFYRPRLDGEFDALLGDQGLVLVGVFFRYTPKGSPNGLELRVLAPGRKN